jgi:hypothetical protein
MTAERCERTDLLVDQCAHCRGEEAPRRSRASRPFPAAYVGSCALGLDFIDEGDTIVMIDGQASHHECAVEAGQIEDNDDSDPPEGEIHDFFD